MNDTWHDLLHGERWSSPETLWVEDDIEYRWRDVSTMATSVEEAIRAHGAARVVHVRSDSKLGCFAGQLGAWRAGTVAVADDGSLGPDELARVRPDLTISVPAGEVAVGSDRLPAGRIPEDVVTVNFTSGTTGSRKAVAVTRENLLALFASEDLDVPARGRLTAGSFATPTYDGWWFDTWRTVAAGGTVVCLPNVNEDVFAWPDLVAAYDVDRLLLPAAVFATVLDVVPEAIAGIPWLFSGGEQFQLSTYHRAREAGLRTRLVNLYGPTEATFATHGYRLPPGRALTTIPIGKPLAGCHQVLSDGSGQHADGSGQHADGSGQHTHGSGQHADGSGQHADGSGQHADGSGQDGGAGLPEGHYRLVVSGPFVCAGYLENGALTTKFAGSYDTGDVVRSDVDGNLVFAGRLDGQLKINGMRVDTTALEDEVVRLPGVSGCRVLRSGPRTLAVAGVGHNAPAEVRPRIESVVRRFSGAIAVRLVDRFPVKPGGKIDTAALLDRLRENGE